MMLQLTSTFLAFICVSQMDNLLAQTDIPRDDCNIGPVDVCGLPKAVGVCKAALRRWYYQPSTKSCVEFTYGGCGGNGNNFESKSECEKRCSVDSDFVRNNCKKPKNKGPCDARITRWYYNASTKKCQTFSYGGCDGNENNFATKQKCEAKCASRKD